MKSFQREKGQGLVEYALILVLVAAVVIGILTLLGPQINIAFSKVMAALNGAGNYEYAINSFSITKTPQSGPSCDITATANITIKENGNPVVDPVNVTGSISGIVNMSISGTVTNGSGTITSSTNVGGSCPSSGSATLVVGGATKSWP